MAIKINLKEVFASQSQEIIVENVNYNFRKLLELGVGETGEQGEMGLGGPPGPPGPEGDQGDQGIRGTQWLISTTDPSLGSPTPDLIQGDMWVNSNTGDVYVWFGSPGTFIPTGFSFADPVFAAEGGEFKRLVSDPSIPGSENQYIVFKNVTDNADSLNDTFLLTNFDPKDPAITNRDFSSAGLYNSLFSIFRKNSSRYHLVLGSFFNDGTDNRLTTQDETVKIRYDYVGNDLYQLDLLLTKQVSNPETSNHTQLNIVTRDSAFATGFKEHIFKVGKNPSWITGISLENGTNGFGMGFETGVTGSPFIIKRDVSKLKFLGGVGATEFTVFEDERIGLFKAGSSPTAFLDVNTANQTYNTTVSSTLSLLKFDRFNSVNDTTNFHIEHQKMIAGASYKADATIIRRNSIYTDTLSNVFTQDYGLILHSGFTTLAGTGQTPIIGVYNTNAGVLIGQNTFLTPNDRINAGFSGLTGQLILSKQYNTPIQSDLLVINQNSWQVPNARIILQSSYVTPYTTIHPLIDIANLSRDISIINLMPSAKTTLIDGSGNYSANIAGIGIGGSVMNSRVVNPSAFAGMYFSENANTLTEIIFTGARDMYSGSIKRHLPLMRLSTGASTSVGNTIHFYGQTSGGTFASGDEITQSTYLQTASSVSRFKIGSTSKEWRFSNNGTSIILPELAIKTVSGRVELRTTSSEISTTPTNLILNTLSTTNYGNVGIGTFTPNAKFHVAAETTGNEFLAAFTGGNVTYPRIGFTIGADTNITLQSSVVGAFYGNFNWEPVYRYITDTYHRLRFEQKVEFASSARLQNTDLYLKTSDSDLNHGLGWYGTGKTFNSVAIDGPVLYGYAGGILGTTSTGENPVLTWKTDRITIEDGKDITTGTDPVGWQIEKFDNAGSLSSNYFQAYAGGWTRPQFGSIGSTSVYDGGTIYWKVIGKTVHLSFLINQFNPIASNTTDFRVLLPTALQNVRDYNDYAVTNVGANPSENVGWFTKALVYMPVKITIRKYNATSGSGQFSNFNGKWCIVINPLSLTPFNHNSSFDGNCRGSITFELA